MPKESTMQSRAPDIPGRRQAAGGTHRSWRLNGEEQEDLQYLVEIWGEDDPKMTENGALRRAITEAANRERGRRR